MKGATTRRPGTTVDAEEVTDPVTVVPDDTAGDTERQRRSAAAEPTDERATVDADVEAPDADDDDAVEPPEPAVAPVGADDDESGWLVHLVHASGALLGVLLVVHVIETFCLLYTSPSPRD